MMRTPLAGRPAPRGRSGTALLLALALCACGADGGDDEKTQPRALLSAQDSTAQADTTPGCTQPPPAYPNAVLQGLWSALRDSLAKDSVTFPRDSANVAVDTVSLCKGCTKIRVELQSSNFTPCLQAEDLAGNARILGQMILLDSFPAQKNFPAIPRGDTIFTFANAPAGPAMLIYRVGNQARRAFSPDWQFRYCQDGHPHTEPEAQWRTVPSITQEDPGGTYGWMACASGCCQYYIKPPTTELPEQAKGNPPSDPPCPGT